MSLPKIVCFSGSLRQQSANTAVLESLREAVADRAELRIVSLAAIPLYNADLDGENAPGAVAAIKQDVAGADALIMSTPEYNYGISGVLKNAIDWISRPAYNSVLKGKPVLVMTASPAATGGVRAQHQLRDTLAACLARVVATPEVVIAQAYAKIEDGRLIDEATLKFATAAIDDLLAEIALLQGK